MINDNGLSEILFQSCSSDKPFLIHSAALIIFYYRIFFGCPYWKFDLTFGRHH